MTANCGLDGLRKTQDRAQACSFFWTRNDAKILQRSSSKFLEMSEVFAARIEPAKSEVEERKEMRRGGGD